MAARVGADGRPPLISDIAGIIKLVFGRRACRKRKTSKVRGTHILMSFGSRQENNFYLVFIVL
jgi:hypothetical protein